MRKPLELICGECPSGVRCLLSKLDSQSLRDLAPRKITNTYTRGQILFYEGKASMGLFLLVSAQVKLYRDSDGRDAVILRLAGPGDVLGHRALFAGEAHSCTAEVIADGQICFLERSTALPLLAGHPEFAREVLRQICLEATEVEDRLRDICQVSVRERLEKLLSRLMAGFGEPSPEGVRLQLPLSRQELAALLGTTQETVVRLLSSFKREGWITLSGRSIVITDPSRLPRPA